MAAAPPTPHDALFRGVFGDPEHAFAHLRTLLPDAVARALESGSLEPLAETFVDGRLAERQCDLLYRVRLAGEQALLYLLLEHLSRVDPRMPVRLLRYLARIPDGRLAGVALVRLILLLLKHGRDPDLFARLAGWADLFREVLRRQGWHSLDLVLECVVGVAEVPGETLAGFFRSQVDHHAGEAIMTLAEQMRQQGRAEGWQQGREEGRQEGQRRLLVRMLQLRFRAVPEAVLRRIDMARTDELDAWAEMLLVAGSPEEVVAEKAPRSAEIRREDSPCRPAGSVRSKARTPDRVVRPGRRREWADGRCQRADSGLLVLSHPTLQPTGRSRTRRDRTAR